METRIMSIVNDAKVDTEYIIYVAKTFKDRFLGLMGKSFIPPKTGLFFPKCSSIHCFFMKVPIDVIYLDKHLTVLYKETVQPWHIGKMVKYATHILELKENDGKNIKIGDKVVWQIM